MITIGSSDIVSGRSGTVGEFFIGYYEGKLIGVLLGIGKSDQKSRASSTP